MSKQPNGTRENLYCNKNSVEDNSNADLPRSTYILLLTKSLNVFPSAWYVVNHKQIPDSSFRYLNSGISNFLWQNCHLPLNLNKTLTFRCYTSHKEQGAERRKSCVGQVRVSALGTTAIAATYCTLQIGLVLQEVAKQLTEAE
jgi:hypothetical protein